MAMPTRYKTTSQPIASYDYNDIAEGTGVVTFYAGTAYDSSGNEDLILSSKTFTSQSKVQRETGDTTTTEETAAFVFEFDLTEFQFPRTLKGRAFLSCSRHFKNNTAGLHGFYLKAYIQKYDGSTATTVGSAREPTWTSTGNDENEKNLTLMINLPQTLFKVGEILRLRITGNYVNAGGASDKDFEVGCDPEDGDGTDLTPSTDDSTTITKIKIPFMIQI